MGITCPGQVLACFSYQKIREFLGVFESLNGSIHRNDVLYFSSIRLLVLFSIQECTFITCVLFFFFWFNVGFQKSRIRLQVPAVRENQNCISISFCNPPFGALYNFLLFPPRLSLQLV